MGTGLIPVFVMFKTKYYDPVYIEPKKAIAD